MVKKIIEERVDIRVYPPITETQSDEDVTELTIGDLHSNPIKLLYSLIRHGICELSKTDYEALLNIYNTCFEYDSKSRFLAPFKKTRVLNMTKATLIDIDTLVEKIIVRNKKTLIRLLGDDLCDRGVNDYFILKIIEKLHKEEANFEILLSNHGIEFLEACEQYEANGQQFKVPRLEKRQGYSLHALIELIDKGTIEAITILEMFYLFYIPHLKIISCSVDETEPNTTLFSHAPINLSIIEKLAEKFGQPYDCSTCIALKTTIERINTEFLKQVRHKNLSSYYNGQILQDAYKSKPPTMDTPIEYLIWNYCCQIPFEPAKNDYTLSFVHGHTEKPFYTHNRVSLDSPLGKLPLYFNEAEYRVLLSYNTPAVTNAPENLSNNASVTNGDHFSRQSNRRKTSKDTILSYEMLVELKVAGTLSFFTPIEEPSCSSDPLITDSAEWDAFKEVEEDASNSP